MEIMIGLGLFAYCLLSQRLDKTIITLPIVFTTLGWLIGSGGLGLLESTISNNNIHLLAEVTLVLVLFADASRINLKNLITDHSLPARMLLVGMPLTILAGTLLIMWVAQPASWAMAFLLATILTPTDAALGQVVVNSPRVPIQIRQAINVESGLNDGIALPIVIICAIAASSVAGEPLPDGPDNLWVFTLLQITLGPLAGAGVGYLSARFMDFALERQWMSTAFQGIAFLAIALLAYAVAHVIGGNGLIAAFIAGMFFGSTLRADSEFLFEFMESEGQLLTLLTFLIFGAVMLPLGLAHITWQTLVLSLVFLTVIRVLPIVISLSGLGLSMPTRLFLGWFGPKGLASILFALLVLEAYPVPGGDEILACVVLTVTLSIFIHGISANPLVSAYSRYVERNQCDQHMNTMPDQLISRTCNPPSDSSPNRPD